MQKSYSYALISGLGIMILAMLLQAANAAWPLAWFLVFCPGFIFGRALVHNKDIGNGKKILFIIIAGLSYILCFWLTNIMRESDRDKILGPIRLIASSMLGAAILSISYALLIRVLKPLVFVLSSVILTGFISAIPSAIFMYLFITVDPYPNGFSADFNFIQFGLMAGIFTMYPLWQIAFVWITNMKSFQPVSVTTATAA